MTLREPLFFYINICTTNNREEKIFFNEFIYNFVFETDRMMIVNNQTYGDVWQSCLTRIREHTSDEEFAKWFKPIVPLDFDGVTLETEGA